MLDQIMASLQSKVGGELKSKAGVSENEMGGIMDVVKGAAMEKIGGKLLGGNMDSVMNLFSNDSNTKEADGLQAGLTSGIMEGLMSKLGFDSSKAQGIVTIVMPMLLKLITKKNEETPSDDASPLTSLFGGNSGMSGMAGKAISGIFG